jgi:hypothetical protein
MANFSSVASLVLNLSTELAGHSCFPIKGAKHAERSSVDIKGQ